MNRPTYETEENRAAEEAFAQDIAARWNVDMAATDKFYDIDRWMLRPQTDIVKGALEVKCLPQHSSEQYAAWKGAFLNIEKYVALRKYAALGLTSRYAVRLPDGDYFCRIRPGGVLNVKLIGRTDRGDPQDIKPAVKIPWMLFEPLIKDHKEII